MGGINWGIGTVVYTPLYTKQITNKDLLYTTGTLLSTLIALWEKNLKTSGYT